MKQEPNIKSAYDIQEFKPCKAFHRESTQKNISIDLSFPLQVLLASDLKHRCQIRVALRFLLLFGTLRSQWFKTIWDVH